jgi:hypothetical protein
MTNATTGRKQHDAHIKAWRIHQFEARREEIVLRRAAMLRANPPRTVLGAAYCRGGDTR